MAADAEGSSDADTIRAGEILGDLERSVDELLAVQNSLPRGSSAHAMLNGRAGRQIVRLLRAFPDANAAAFLAFLNPSQLDDIMRLLRRKENGS